MFTVRVVHVCGMIGNFLVNFARTSTPNLGRRGRAAARIPVPWCTPGWIAAKAAGVCDAMNTTSALDIELAVRRLGGQARLYDNYDHERIIREYQGRSVSSDFRAFARNAIYVRFRGSASFNPDREPPHFHRIRPRRHYGLVGFEVMELAIATRRSSWYCGPGTMFGGPNATERASLPLYSKAVPETSGNAKRRSLQDTTLRGRRPPQIRH